LGIAGGAVLTIALIVAVGMTVARSPYVTGQAIRREQPVPFSHQHHVADAGIDCRYCHATVEKSAMAGLPTSEVCMNCHRVLWNQSKMLEPVRLSYRDNIPIQWNRVHDLPDHVYFNHSIHIKKGIGCYSCHGRIDEMPLTEQAQPLNMEWCLDCHRDPRQHVRPAHFLYVTKPLEELIAAGAQSAERVRAEAAATQQPKSRTDCYTCHR
ncbi:MAG: cytochrome c3 family protein, partial [Aureliella sp.]